MNEQKLDRGNLRRQAQRVEPYSVLLNKRKSYTRTDKLSPPLRKYRSEGSPKLDNKENEEEDQNKINNELPSSPASNKSSSSESSQEFQSNLLNRWKLSTVSSRSEFEASSVMTRAATRKYVSVGSVHNKVDLDQELRVTKRWPVTVSYPTQTPPDDHLLLLKNAVSKSLNHVMSFCKYAGLSGNKCESENDAWELNEGDNYIDLSPYLTQEPVIINGNSETQITLHLDEGLLSHQYINIISLHDENASDTLLIQEDNKEFETITLHSGETYVLDNKYLNTENSSFVNLSNDLTPSRLFPPFDPMLAICNDHTYASKCRARPTQLSEIVAAVNKKNSDSQFENALNDLLLDTAILKCLICGDPPQEVTAVLNSARHHNVI